MDFNIKDVGTAGNTVKTSTSYKTMGGVVGGGVSGAISFAQGMIFAIEYITYSLYFFEEGFVVFMRQYHEMLYTKWIPDILVYTRNDFDYMFGWYEAFFEHYGVLAVYSYNAFVNYLYMLQMYREYAEILMGGDRYDYHCYRWLMWEGFVDQTNKDTGLKTG